MGTLGCINDMMRQDKTNRELRKRGRERMRDTRLGMLSTRRNKHASDIELYEMERIDKQLKQKDIDEARIVWKGKLVVLGICLSAGLLIGGLAFLLQSLL